MSAASRSGFLRVGKGLALEVMASCAVGDHDHHSRQSVRAMFGFSQLAMGSILNLRRSTRIADAGSDVLFVVNNPVAHGSQFARAVLESARSSRMATVSDHRLADKSIPVDLAFPGVSPRSLRAITTLERLRFAFELRRLLPRGARLLGASSRLYGEYLFAAQAIRYAAVHAIVSMLPDSTVVLTDFDRAAYGRPWIWTAGARGLETITLVHGSPNETNYVPVLARHAFVWGEVQRAWLEQRSPDTLTAIVGRPELRAPSMSRTAAERAVICHSREVLSSEESRVLSARLREFRARGLRIVLRLHPTAAEQDLDARWTAVAKLADEVITGRESFLDSLRPSDIVVCVSSSSAVEAVVSGIPTIIVADDSRVLPSDLEAIRTSSSGLLDELQKGSTSPGVEVVLANLAGRLVAALDKEAGVLLDKALTAVRDGLRS